jgi:hypothetical protein
MIKKFLILTVAALYTVLNVNAQGSCGTDDLYNQLKQKYPQIAINESQLEQAIQQGMQKINLSKTAAKSTANYDDSTYYDVPIVVHIVHDYGTEYITDNAVIDAVKNWSDTYLAQNADTSDVIPVFKPYIGNARIRLHLATIDPNGKPTKGITRDRTYLTTVADDDAKIGGWPNDSYINIWLINKFSANHNGAAAYAYYPSSGAYMPYYDGVISLSTYVNTDKTIPHELGHVLNLSHTWGNTNNAGVACGDDGVDDTPPTTGHNVTGCTASALYDITCASGYTKNGIDYPDTTNAQNIMDYTYCEKMFTKGQVQRMRLALTNNTAGRNNLITAANLAKTGALAPMPDLPATPDFSVERGVVTSERCYFLCADAATKFVFKNRSWNDTITSVQWTFSNGATTPSISSTGTVNNQFSQPGWVTVSLTATGNNTSPVTLTNTHTVYVADNNTIPWGAFSNNFWNANSVDNWPMFNYYENQFKWEWYSGTGYDDGSCIRYKAYDNRTSPADKTGSPAGDHDDMFTPGIDLTKAQSNLNLNFFSAGAGSNDSLQIFLSNDCGSSWKYISSLKGSALNNNFSSGEFVPTSSQWKPQTIAIPSTYYTDKVFFKLRYWPSGSGKDFYIDNFGVSQFPTEVKQAMQNPGAVKIYPNPAHGNCTLAFQTGNDGKVSYQVKDVTGRTLYVKDNVYGANMAIQENLANSIFPTSGVYFVTVTISGNSITQKLIIE